MLAHVEKKTQTEIFMSFPAQTLGGFVKAKKRWIRSDGGALKIQLRMLGDRCEEWRNSFN